ncbi:hypothetical protein [Nitratifractor sp.]
MEPTKTQRVVRMGMFYLAALVMVGILASIFPPAAETLRKVARRDAHGIEVLVPPLFLLAVFFGAFLRARAYARKDRFVASMGWLMGSTALTLVLLYLYLVQMVR